MKPTRYRLRLGERSCKEFLSHLVPTEPSGEGKVPIRFKKGSPRRRHFIAEWRRHRQLSQAVLGAELGISKASVSRIERCVQPYTQDILEAIADVLGTEPAILLSCRPEESDTLFSVWERIPKAGRRQALAVLRALASSEADK